MRTFDEMNRLFREMDRTFEQMRHAWWGEYPAFETARPAIEATEPAIETTGPVGETNGLTGVGTWPSVFGDATVDLSEEGEEYVFVMDLPGFETEDVDLTFDDGLLSVRAFRDVEEGSDHVRSMRSRQVRRQVAIPKEITPEEITATYRNGVLEVHLPIVDGDREESGHHIDIE